MDEWLYRAHLSALIIRYSQLAWLPPSSRSLSPDGIHAKKKKSQKGAKAFEYKYKLHWPSSHLSSPTFQLRLVNLCVYLDPQRP
jgi:hypothetical protein